MTGVVDVGGGLRGIYGAGVFDYCLDHEIRFDYCIGVSAGSANIASFLGGQRGRNYRFYMEYAFRRQYMSLSNLIHTGSYLNLDYCYGELSREGGENPLDYEAIRQSPAVMKVVAMDAVTGRTVYFDKCDMFQDHYDILKASSSIPLVCKPYVVNGIPCYDGGLSDPVPVQKAFDDGCDRVAVILTRPENFVRVPGKDARMARLLRHRYPKAAEGLAKRWQTYNDGVALAKRYAGEKHALILAPGDTCGLNTLTKNKKSLEQLYRKGYRNAAALQRFLTEPSQKLKAEIQRQEAF